MHHNVIWPLHCPGLMILKQNTHFDDDDDDGGDGDGDDGAPTERM